MFPSSPQLAPVELAASLRKGTTAPPSTEILPSFPLAVNPTHWPSGEKNGELAPWVPGSSVPLG